MPKKRRKHPRTNTPRKGSGKPSKSTTKSTPKTPPSKRSKSAHPAPQNKPRKVKQTKPELRINRLLRNAVQRLRGELYDRPRTLDRGDYKPMTQREKEIQMILGPKLNPTERATTLMAHSRLRPQLRTPATTTEKSSWSRHIRMKMLHKPGMIDG